MWWVFCILGVLGVFLLFVCFKARCQVCHYLISPKQIYCVLPKMQLQHLHKLNSFNIVYIVMLRSVIVEHFQNGCLNAQTLHKLPIAGNNCLVPSKAMFVGLLSVIGWSVGYRVNVSWYSVIANLVAMASSFSSSWAGSLVTSTWSFWIDFWENTLKRSRCSKKATGSASSFPSVTFCEG